MRECFYIIRMFTHVKTLGRCFYRAGYIGIIKHDAIEHAGYLTYISMLALFPFLVLLAYVAGWIGQGETGTQFVQLVLDHLPAEAVNAIRPRLLEITAEPPQGLVTVSLLGAIWTASSLVQGWRTSLNNAYHVSTPPAYWFRRLMSVVQLMLFIVVVIVSMMGLVLAPIVIENIEHWIGMDLLHEDTLDIGDLIFSFSGVALFLAVAILYHVLPNIRQTLLDVIPGAVVTVGLWLGSASIFSYYLSDVWHVSVIYGSLGGIIASLVFFFIINLFFILGAEFNYQLRMAYGGAKPQEREQGAPYKENDLS